MTPLPALSDIPVHALTSGDNPPLLRFENAEPAVAEPILMEKLRSVYPHEQVYGEFCPVQGYIDADPTGVFEYLADVRSLEEWTYSLRGFTETSEPGLWAAVDRLGGDDAAIYTRVVAHPGSGTVDYHCAWDQHKHLWMIYLLRVVDAQLVFDKPGAVVLWVNCHHPFYDENPFPETAPPGREIWVGDLWDMFPAGHRIELENLTAICEYRSRHGLPIKPDWMHQ